jgi:hypothetical protein
VKNKFVIADKICKGVKTIAKPVAIVSGAIGTIALTGALMSKDDNDENDSD